MPVIPLRDGERPGLSQDAVVPVQTDENGSHLNRRQHFDGVNWETAFATEAGVRQEMRFPFHDLVAVYRGKSVSGAPPFDPGRIATFGLLISDRQSGPFRLEIETVAAYQ